MMNPVQKRTKAIDLSIGCMELTAACVPSPFSIARLSAEAELAPHTRRRWSDVGGGMWPRALG
jgi:hypothetical protein